MKKVNQSVIGRLLLSVLILSLVLSALSGCVTQSYVADDKTQIQQNIDSTLDSKKYEYVSDHLREWGMPLYDTMKFKYFEDVFHQIFNHNSGMPEVIDHAKMTAASFLEGYYDEIDLTDKTAVTNALLTCYVNVLGDPYSAYRPPVEAEAFDNNMSGKFGGIGVIVEYDHTEQTILISTVYPASPADKAGIKSGDYLYAVDGKTVEEIGYDNAIDYVRGEIGTPVELTVLRGEELVTVTAIRGEVEEINVAYEIDYENNIGYVQIVSFKSNTFDQFKTAIDSLEAEGVDGIIFDLRSNLGGYVKSVVDVVSYLIPDGNVIISYAYKNRPEVVTLSQDAGEDHAVDLPFVILCDYYTASSAEIFTAAMRDYNDTGLVRATIVGTTTYKKGVIQNTYYYPFDMSTVTLTVAYYKPPCGVNFDGVGIEPDVYVEYDGGEADNQLEAGIKELISLINAN